MRINLARFLLIMAPACICGLAIVDTYAQETPASPVPLALVGEDTLTTTELKIELAIMKNRNEEKATASTLDPEKVLRRLTQNHLVIQEGYRMGLDQEFTVTNQILEIVRHECMAALLDSVAYSVPKETPDYHEARRLAVRNYLEDLEHKYDASYDADLLASLDYGSADPEMQEYLKESQEILAVVPTGRLSVAAFSRIVRFTEFHGLIGKHDADEKRDKVFEEWFAEALLNYQYQAQDMDQAPHIVLIAERMERQLVLEESLKVLLKFDFAPTEKEVEKFYQANLNAVTPTPRVKMKSLKAPDEEKARALYDKMLRGTPVSWLYSNDPSVVQGPPPFPEEFFKPEQLGLKPEMLEVGFIPPPYQVPTGWVVAVISEVENPDPLPLASCRIQIISMMEAEQVKQTMIDVLDQLEKVSPVVILPGAEATVADVIQEFEEKERAAQAESFTDTNGEG